MTPTVRYQWLNDRRKGLGASDGPNLIGVGWKNAAQVYRSKVEPPAILDPQTGPLARGIALEEHAAAMYSARMGVELASEPMRAHPNRPWQLASPDRVRPDGRRVQIKVYSGLGSEWGEELTGQVPHDIATQVQQEMGVTETDSIDIGVLDVIAWYLYVYRATFDPEFFAWLTDVESRFWFGHVEPRIPPGPEWDAQFRPEEVLRKLQTDTTPDLGPEIATLIDRRKAFGSIRDEADDEYRRLGERITAVMGDHKKATAGAWVVNQIEVAGGEYAATRKPSSRLDIRATKEKR